MNIPKFFRSRRPKPATVHQLSREDIQDLVILRWHDLTPEQWDDMPALAKVDHREAFYRARGMAS